MRRPAWLRPYHAGRWRPGRDPDGNRAGVEPEPGRPAVLRLPHSLRWRVTVAAVLIVAMAFLTAGVAVDVALSAQLRRDDRSRLTDRAARATVLVAQGAAESDLPDLVDGQGLRATLIDASGRRLTAGPPDPPGAPDGPRAPRPAGRGGDRVLRTSVALPSGHRLVLTTDPGPGEEVIDRLRVVMAVVGVVGLAVTAFALLGGVELALRPLDAMTGLARAITAGDRGRRLRPQRTDTEIGRTAAAFDEMLDALDAAQGRAEQARREAEQARGHAEVAQDRAEEARRRAETAADEAVRSEATTRRFLSDAAHELRTPITGVQALAESLVRHPDADLERRERVATTLVRETRRAGALVADMLELARIEGDPALDRRPVDLAELAAAEAERVELLAPGLRIAVEGGPVTVVADPARVTQVLANLLANARRHSPESGTITLTTGVDDGAAVVEVVDEGPGVPEADRERIFDRLVRLDDARTRDAGGAGLGLAIARALARAHGGDLRLVPTDAGARFRLTLPLAD